MDTCLISCEPLRCEAWIQVQWNPRAGKGSAAAACSWVSAAIPWTKFCSFATSILFVFSKAITPVSMGSATTAGRQNQPVQMGTWWRGRWRCGCQMSGLCRNIGTPGAGPTAKASLRGRRTCQSCYLHLIICSGITLTVPWLAKEQLFSNPRILSAAFLLQE